MTSLRCRKMPESNTDLRKRAANVLRALQKEYPDAHCELHFTTPLELAIGCILSAQCTDVRVNQVTPPLFARYQTPADWLQISQTELEQMIHSTGFFRNKAKSILGLCAALEKDHDSQLPANLDLLIQLPGIGRKTANVIMVSAFGQPGIVVDTHMKRLANRLGFTTRQDPDRIEFDLRELIPMSHWGAFSHAIVFHGRRCCFARNPHCSRCVVRQWCPSRDQFGSPKRTDKEAENR